MSVTMISTGLVLPQPMSFGAVSQRLSPLARIPHCGQCEVISRRGINRLVIRIDCSTEMARISCDGRTLIGFAVSAACTLRSDCPLKLANGLVCSLVRMFFGPPPRVNQVYGIQKSLHL